MRSACFLASVVALTGCSAIVNPDPGRLGSDAGQVHLMDSGTPPVPDAGRDAGVRRDTGTGCVTGAYCDGDTLVSCRGGVESRTSCPDMGSFCSGDRCQTWVCEPGSRECTGDGRGVIVCDARGANEAMTPCPLGCDPATNACITTSPACMGLPRIAVGDDQAFDLCRETDDDTYTPTSDGCPAPQEAAVGDRVFALTIEHEMDVVINLRDVDTLAAVDTVVYVRRACDDAATQTACDDDVPCDASTLGGFCTGTEVRESRIFVHLTPGIYYVVADAFAYSTDRTMYRCGNVQLSVEEAGG